jgi:dTDP-4-amino-4,6-dideoxygalactose transaminase
MIPCANPLAQYQSQKEEILAAVTHVLEAGNYILGPEVDRFEKSFAAYCGVQNAVGVNSGTDALLIALKALDIGANDEVITVSHTAVATVAAVLASGATPVLVDIDPVFYTIDPERVAAAITPRTKAIIAVHLYGQSADLDALLAVSKAHNLPLIEDCAQSTGAFYKGRRHGSIGDIGCFSFYPTKNLGAIGDGGMVVTSNAALSERMRRVRQYGWNDTRSTETPGINSRLDEIQAAILGVKLTSLDSANARRAAIARRYAAALQDLPLTLPAARPDTSHVYHLYVLTCDDRGGLKKHLAAHQVGAGIHYPVPAHLHGGYNALCRLPPAGLPTTERLVGRILTLPMYPELTDAQVDDVIAAVRGYRW